MKQEIEAIIAQLESCGYECQGGPLELNVAFIKLKDLNKFAPTGTVLIDAGMPLSELLIQIDKFKTQKTELFKEHEQQKANLDAILTKLTRLKTLAMEGINTSLVGIAEKLISCSGQPYNFVDGRRLTESAALDIAKGAPFLRTRCFGNKQYDRFYQAADCEYGMGPRHGSIVDRISLNQRNHEFTEEEKTACIYYLENYEKIVKATIAK